MNKKYQDWIKKGLAKGLSDVEVYASSSTNLSIDVYQGKVEKNEISKMNTASIKGIYNDRAVRVRVEDFSDANVDRLLDLLVVSVKNITSNEKEFVFGGSEKYQEVNDEVFDFAAIDPKVKVQLLIDIEKGILENKFAHNVQSVSYSETESKVEIVNSKGLNLSKHQRYAMAYASGVYKENDQIKSGMSYQIVRDYNDFNVDKLINDNIKFGTSQLGGKSIKSGSYPIVFSNEMFGAILAVFSGIFNGEAAFRKLTKLVDKQNTKIANELVNLVDDPFYEDALFKVAFDDEGVATKKRYWIKDGVFTDFSHNLKTADIFKTESTGNGFGGGISASNLVFENGENTFDEIVASVDKGIYITDLSGLHAGVETVSGDFSVQASGFLIEDGKVARPVEMIVLSGNFFKLLNDVEAVGNDLIFGLYGIGSPSVKVKALTIAGE